MARQRNRNVVYSGPVTGKMRRPPKSFGCTRKAPPKKTAWVLTGGPLDGQTVRLFDCSATLPITLNGQTGRYLNNTWVPA